MKSEKTNKVKKGLLFLNFKISHALRSHEGEERERGENRETWNRSQHFAVLKPANDFCVYLFTAP